MADNHAAPSEPEADALERAVAERDAAAQALFECRRFAAQLAIERQHLSDAFDTVRADEHAAAREAVAPEVAAALRERDGALAERDAALAARDAALADRDHARAEAQEARHMLERVTSSTAWRVTGPVRRLMQTVLGR